MSTATGSFEVQLTPLPSSAEAEGAVVGRRSIVKQFHGDLEASSAGEMLSAGSPVKGSAGYVAIEWVSGKLQGRSGSFALQHFGVMERGAGRLTVSVVPDSGSGELVGLSGKLDVRIVDGQHFYDFDYSLDAAP
ncbi:MAG TPA: DUF3224 domain-containing protein [Methylibium sp.]